ncbi:hypothetical protein [Pacificoceanicola onchidii]|uniref:hypothetical protein n=1 Tax=Pacificoceanicola onchidii TaxID=2562685 RepID=UPI0014561B17|nr:hypothetical protein [Pacificoceanicola onchidii]
MARAVLMTSVLTGVFCALFSVVVGALSMALSPPVLIGLSFVSGFCGSLFAQLVMKRGK